MEDEVQLANVFETAIKGLDEYLFRCLSQPLAFPGSSGLPHLDQIEYAELALALIDHEDEIQRGYQRVVSLTIANFPRTDPAHRNVCRSLGDLRRPSPPSRHPLRIQTLAAIQQSCTGCLHELIPG